MHTSTQWHSCTQPIYGALSPQSLGGTLTPKGQSMHMQPTEMHKHGTGGGAWGGLGERIHATAKRDPPLVIRVYEPESRALKHPTSG